MNNYIGDGLGPDSGPQLKHDVIIGRQWSSSALNHSAFSRPAVKFSIKLFSLNLLSCRLPPRPNSSLLTTRSSIFFWIILRREVFFIFFRFFNDFRWIRTAIMWRNAGLNSSIGIVSSDGRSPVPRATRTRSTWIRAEFAFLLTAQSVTSGWGASGVAVSCFRSASAGRRRWRRWSRWRGTRRRRRSSTWWWMTRWWSRPSRWWWSRPWNSAGWGRRRGRRASTAGWSG